MKIIFGFKSLSLFVKSSNLHFRLDPEDASNKHFYVLSVNILHVEKKRVLSTSVCFSLLFQKKMWLNKRVVGRVVLIERGRRNK